MENEEKINGRPTAYKPEYDVQGYKLCLLGATDKQLADFFGVKEQTINNWKKAHESFFVSLKAGKEQADAMVANSLFKRATGYKAKAVKFAQQDGVFTDAKEYIEEYAPDTTACIFWLKNRRPDLWRDKVQQELSGVDGEPIKTESLVKVYLPDNRRDDT